MQGSCKSLFLLSHSCILLLTYKMITIPESKIVFWHFKDVFGLAEAFMACNPLIPTNFTTSGLKSTKIYGKENVSVFKSLGFWLQQTCITWLPHRNSSTFIFLRLTKLYPHFSGTTVLHSTGLYYYCFLLILSLATASTVLSHSKYCISVLSHDILLHKLLPAVWVIYSFI